MRSKLIRPCLSVSTKSHRKSAAEWNEVERHSCTELTTHSKRILVKLHASPPPSRPPFQPFHQGYALRVC